MIKNIGRQNKIPKRTITEDVIDKISKLTGPMKAEHGAAIWMASAFADADRDRKLQQHSARIAHNTLGCLKKAFPDVDPEFVGAIAADLTSLWDTGQKLDKELRKLSQMRFPQHRNHLLEFLSFIEATQIDMVEYWIGNLRKRIPKLRKQLSRQEGHSQRPPGRKDKLII